jgi:hypothetical protein
MANGEGAYPRAPVTWRPKAATQERAHAPDPVRNLPAKSAERLHVTVSAAP